MLLKQVLMRSARLRLKMKMFATVLIGRLSEEKPIKSANFLNIWF